MKELRRHQIEAVQALTARFAGDSRRFRYRMATGTGKTVTASHAVEVGMAGAIGVDGKRIVVLCHTNNLTSQFEERFYEEFPNPKANWEFHTYQSFVLKEPEDDLFMLVIDEIHQGGQSKEEGSYKSIIENWRPKYLLTLSATDAGVDEAVFGPRFGPDSYTYTFKQALEDGILTNVMITTIHTGLSQTLEDGAKLEGTDVGDIIAQDNEAGVNLAHEKNVDLLEKTKISAAIQTYLLKEAGNPVLFYCSNKKFADWGAEEFKRLAGGKYRVRVAHSDLKEADKNIEDFLKGRFAALFNCRMFREGVDYPALAVAFDTNPSVTNEGRSLIQGVGRVTRLFDGKGLGRYYVCVSPNSNRVDVAEMAKERGLSEEAAEVFAADTEMRAGFAVAMEQEGREAEVSANEVMVNLAATQPEFFDMEAVVDHVAAKMAKPTNRVALTSGLLIRDASGSKEVDQKRLSDLLRRRERGSLTYEVCLESARPHPSPGKWSEADPSAYALALRNGWSDRIYKEVGMVVRTIRKSGSLTYKVCLESARPHPSPSKWQEVDASAYKAAHHNGWAELIYNELGWPPKQVRKRKEDEK